MQTDKEKKSKFGLDNYLFGAFLASMLVGWSYGIFSLINGSLVA